MSKKKIIPLQDKNITFKRDNVVFLLSSFSPASMTCELIAVENGLKSTLKAYPFAHLPKEIKKIINPL
jgi:hypothetical protein